jgi:FkbM family methyltransferase
MSLAGSAIGSVKRYTSAFRWYASAIGLRQAVAVQLARVARVKTMELSIDGIARPVICRPGHTDRVSLCQVILERDADIELPYTPRLIIDGGANVGYASVVFANRYPNATIVAVEPDADNFRLAQQNCAPYKNVHLVQGGIWTKDAWLVVDNPDAGSDAFQLREVEHQVPGAVRGHTVASLAKKWGFDEIDLLKLDIEGAEEPIFNNPDRAWLDQVRALVIETHGAGALAAVESAFASRDYDRRLNGEKLVFTRRG